MIKYLPFLLVLAVWIYAFIDCLNTPEKEVRKLPKVMWVIIVLLFGQVLIGPIAWFAVGRPRKTAYGSTKANERRWVAPDDNPDFLKSLREDEGSGSGGGQARKPDAEESLDRWEEEFRRNRKGKGDTGGPDDTPPPPSKS